MRCSPGCAPGGHPLTNVQWIAVKRNRLWACVFPLNNHRHRDREVKQSSNCQPRRWSEKRGREREREMRVYKQAPCNKFVFSRCQVPWPSLRLSVRSILFGLACARASAINFTECYELLIRLANGACNLAEAKPTVLWIADKLIQKLQPLWLKFLCVFVCVKLSDCDCACAYIHVPSTCVFGGSESFLAAANLPPKKGRQRLFTWHTPLFSVCLKLDGSEMGSFMVSTSLKMARQSSVAEHWNNLVELWFTFIYTKLQGYLISRQAHATIRMKPDREEGEGVG